MLKFKKPPVKQAAFSLVELIVVLVVIGVLAAVAIPRFSSNEDFEARSAAAEILTQVRFAQQLAMNNTSRNTQLVINAGSLSILQDGIARTNYPINIAANYDVTLSDITLAFDSLGNTTPVTISVSSTPQIQICIAASGYAQLC